MKKDQTFLKQLGASVTGFVNSLLRDVFLRTEVIVILTLFFLCFLYLIIVAISSYYLQIEIAQAVLTNINNMIASGDLNSAAQGRSILSDISEVRNSFLLIIGGISLITTILFGYLVIRLALIPTKNALSAQKQFIGNVAHELRTPLAILKANNEVLLLERSEDREIEEMTKSNNEEINRISGIINNLLTLNILASSSRMQFASVNLNTVVEKSIQKFERMAHNKKLQIEVHQQDEPTHVWGNENALMQIVVNIVKNAISYSRNSGRVDIHIGQTDSVNAFLEVTDTGIGIEQKKLKRVFEPFYRIDSSRVRTDGSSGLGLTIVNELVKLHYGKIAIKSTYGHGTMVRIELPKTPQKLSKNTETHQIAMDLKTGAS